ncbi:hypothetical protein [Flaviaesturariibacter amylovorans]|uniref:Lipoprotein n=1 Tax=Flaviaesturariibacter amylovorans TaxID=1084520 RepID=A0ABP8H9X9_9BACT
MRYLISLLLLLCVACSPYRGMRRASFTYTAGGSSKTVPMKVPRGWRDVRSEAGAEGAQSRVYRYRDGSVFYVQYAPSGGDVQPIDRAAHIPSLRANGDTSYKQQTGERYWREDKKGLLRAGYINVPEGTPEMRFDSAVNSVKRVNG